MPPPNPPKEHQQRECDQCREDSQRTIAPGGRSGWSRLRRRWARNENCLSLGRGRIFRLQVHRGGVRLRMLLGATLLSLNFLERIDRGELGRIGVITAGG